MAEKKTNEKKVLNKKTLLSDVEKFRKDNKVNKSLLSLAWMDAYVAKFHKEKIYEYAKKCATFPKTKKGKDNKERIDIISLRKYFLEEFLPDLTDEAIEKRKAEARAKKEAEKKNKKELTLEEKIVNKLQALADEED